MLLPQLTHSLSHCRSLTHHVRVSEYRLEWSLSPLLLPLLLLLQCCPDGSANEPLITTVGQPQGTPFVVVGGGWGRGRGDRVCVCVCVRGDGVGVGCTAVLGNGSIAGSDSLRVTQEAG